MNFGSLQLPLLLIKSLLQISMNVCLLRKKNNELQVVKTHPAFSVIFVCWLLNTSLSWILHLFPLMLVSCMVCYLHLKSMLCVLVMPVCKMQTNTSEKSNRQYNSCDNTNNYGYLLTYFYPPCIPKSEQHWGCKTPWEVYRPIPCSEQGQL